MAVPFEDGDPIEEIVATGQAETGTDKVAGVETPAPMPEKRDLIGALTLIPPEENPWGEPVVDCRFFAREVTSFTLAPEMAASFTSGRSTRAEDFRGSHPNNSVTIPSSLAYPRMPDTDAGGALFRSTQMEDKWDVFLPRVEHLLRAKLDRKALFRADARPSSRGLHVSSIEATMDAQDGWELPAWFLVLQVDFLIKSHVYGHEIPHPMPPAVPMDRHSIATYSFAQYGRRASFAAYCDTSQFRL